MALIATATGSALKRNLARVDLPALVSEAGVSKERAVVGSTTAPPSRMVPSHVRR